MGMVLNRLEKNASFKEKVYEELKSAILMQRIRPGELLNERALAVSLGVSRTPVREAMQLLEREGLIITEPWKGSRVKEITKQDIEEVFQLRLVLEPLAVELASQRITEKDYADIEFLNNRQAEYGQIFHAGEFIKSDMELHMLLVRLAGNERLTQIIGNLIDTMKRLGISAIHTRSRYAETLDEHAKIVKALKERDAAKAREAAIYHVLRTKETLFRLLK